MRDVTTDAVIGNDPVTGQPTHPDARDMASDAEAGSLRDALMLLSPAVVKELHVDRRAQEWASQDSAGLKPWLLEFNDGTTQRVSRMLDLLDQQPGSKWASNGAGGVILSIPNLAPPDLVSGGPGSFAGLDPSQVSPETKMILAAIADLKKAVIG